MSKTKENDHVKPQRRVSGSHVSLSATQQSDEFFTDSILESDATRTSRIPNPVLQKSMNPQSRRSRKSTKNSSLKTQVSSGSSKIVRQVTSKDKNLQPAIEVRRTKSPSPLRNGIASTPPQTRIRTDIASPSIEIQSPPPEGFMDVYRQIAEEEDLAATERESSGSDDSHPAQSDNEEIAALGYSHRLAAPHRSRSARSPSSRSSTPTHYSRRPDTGDDLSPGPRTANSEPTGMSFLNEMTNQQLAAILTPHVSESAKDRARLRKVWSNQKPVAFTKAGKFKPSPKGEIGEGSFAEPYSRASGKVERAIIYESDSDRSNRPQSRHSDGSLENYAVRLGSWDESGRPLKDLPTNTRIERKFNFTTRHGFPQGRSALTAQNLEQQNRAGKPATYSQLGSPSPTSHYSDPVLSHRRISDDRQDVQKEYSIRAQRVRNGVLDLVESGLILPQAGQQETKVPAVNRTAAAADITLPPDKDSLKAPPGDVIAGSSGRFASPEKSRRWDFDLTGQSFQVSESPPVRNKQLGSDPYLGKEIANLNKRAVTTNRLGEIRERHSQEQLKSNASPSAMRSSSTSSERRRETRSNQPELDEVMGEPIPNTPVVVFRSSSSSSSEKKFMDQDKELRGGSDEYLQRFAKAMSSTPKQNPSPTSVSLDIKKEDGAQNGSSKHVVDNKKSLNLDSADVRAPLKIAETPKVIGAWTDTLLPDTVKPVRSTATQAKYMQTPHVSAGGWVDTPIVPGTKKAPEMTPIIEEVPEELINGIARGKVTQNPDSGRSDQEGNNGAPNVQVEVPKMGLAGILNRAKQRLISQDITIAARENDTLNLGNETIESLQDLLTLDPDEFTVLSKVFNEDDENPEAEDAQAEAVILERIGTKLDRLRSNIHEARKGISKLEHKVSQSDAAHEHQNHTAGTICTACSKTIYSTSPYPQSASFPITPLHITLPIPLLFRFQSTSTTSASMKIFGLNLPRPSPLGYLVLAVWLWYITECTLSEIYSHPTHAEYYAWPSPHQSEPEFPYVLPTMLGRWFQLENMVSFLSLLVGWIISMFYASMKVFSMWAGWTDGFIDSDGVKNIVKSVTNTAAASMGIETDMSMMNDEYL